MHGPINISFTVYLQTHNIQCKLIIISIHCLVNWKSYSLAVIWISLVSVQTSNDIETALAICLIGLVFYYTMFLCVLWCVLWLLMLAVIHITVWCSNKVLIIVLHFFTQAMVWYCWNQIICDCEFFCSGVTEHYLFLGHDAGAMGNWILVFWANVDFSYSRVKLSYTC